MLIRDVDRRADDRPVVRGAGAGGRPELEGRRGREEPRAARDRDAEERAKSGHWRGRATFSLSPEPHRRNTRKQPNIFSHTDAQDSQKQQLKRSGLL